MKSEDQIKAEFARDVAEVFDTYGHDQKAFAERFRGRARSECLIKAQVYFRERDDLLKIANRLFPLSETFIPGEGDGK